MLRVRVVASGDPLLSPQVTRAVIERFVEMAPADAQLKNRIAQLTARETEVLRLLSRGLNNAELTKQLFVSEPTVKTHVASILQKLGVRDRVQAVIAAYESGLVRPAASG